MGQLGFGFERIAGGERPPAKAAEDELFQDGEPRELFVGAQRLEVYFEREWYGVGVAASRVAQGVRLLSFRRSLPADGAPCPASEGDIGPGGLRNHQPAMVVARAGRPGAARRDVGVWWVCGGHQPDHSSIGKFIQLHAEILSEKFFVELVKSLMSKLRLAPGKVAAEGTVIEAAASDYRLLRAEAMMEAARAAQAAADASPSDEKLAHKAQVAQHAASIAHERLRLRQRHGHSGNRLSNQKPRCRPARTESCVLPTSQR